MSVEAKEALTKKPVLSAGPQKKGNFEEEELLNKVKIVSGEKKTHPEVYYNVLESKNKNFGQILLTSESQSEIGVPAVNV